MAKRASILGAHMSMAGGYFRAVEIANCCGCDCVQLFTKNNNQWRAKEITEDDVDRFQSSLKELMRRVEAGDADAELKLWNQFYEKLLRHVEARIRHGMVPVGLVDEESVTVSVLESVFKCAKKGRLQSVQSWSELSRLLYAMTNRKFVNHWRRATAQRRYPGQMPESLPPDGIQIPDDELPGYSLAFEEQLSRLMDLLPDELHRRIAVLKLAEYTLAEIGEKVDRAVPTVNRKWRTIRKIWADELEK